jgi:hypothetical protein
LAAIAASCWLSEASLCWAFCRFRRAVSKVCCDAMFLAARSNALKVAGVPAQKELERSIRDDPVGETPVAGLVLESKFRGNVSIRELPERNHRVPFSFYDHDNESEERSCCKGHQQIKKTVSDI